MKRIRRLGGNQELHPDFGSNPDYGIPFEVVPQSQPDVAVEIGPDGYPDESDFGPAPIPADASIEGGSELRRRPPRARRPAGRLRPLRALPRLPRRRRRLDRRLDRILGPGVGRAQRRGRHLGRRRRAADPSGPRPLRGGCRGRGRARDPRHVLTNPARLHPSRDPLRLELVRPQPAADGPAAADEAGLLRASTSPTSPPASRRGRSSRRCAATG